MLFCSFNAFVNLDSLLYEVTINDLEDRLSKTEKLLNVALKRIEDLEKKVDGMPAIPAQPVTNQPPPYTEHGFPEPPKGHLLQPAFQYNYQHHPPVLPTCMDDYHCQPPVAVQQHQPTSGFQQPLPLPP